MRADELAREELARLEQQDLLRALEPLSGPPGSEIALASGERLVNFSSNDYLGLAGDPRIGRALAGAAVEWGAGAGASRLVCGDFVPQHELEQELARFEDTEAALLFNSGYAANCGLLPALAGPGDAIVSDALNHASIIDGCRLSRARVHVYAHADPGAADAACASARAQGARRVLLVTDTVFSMDGDRAPLEALAAICERHDALFVVDEAHATGVLGPRGAGLVSLLGLGARVDARMGTLSKAAGVVGAHVASSAALRALLVNRARTLVFSTALPPALAVAARAALSLLAGPEGDERRARLAANVARLAAGLRALGLPAAGSSAILPVVLGEPGRAMAAARALRERGLLVKPIRPPTVPAGTSRLRFALSAAHTDDHVDRALAALREVV